MGPRAGLDGCGKSCSPHRDSIPGSPTRSSVAIPTELPGRHEAYGGVLNYKAIRMAACVYHSA